MGTESRWSEFLAARICVSTDELRLRRRELDDRLEARETAQMPPLGLRRLCDVPSCGRTYRGLASR
jgi:hypothetical protein